MSRLFLSSDLEQLFSSCFYQTFNTVLIGGFDEPLYLPATEQRPAQIHYRENFFASALHEVAHWCLAGERRLQLEDYGYWYQPVRDISAQKRFEAAELLPQAIEMMLARACNFPFKVSVDNLELPDYDSSEFRQAVSSKLASMDRGDEVPPFRAVQFATALEEHYRSAA